MCKSACLLIPCLAFCAEGLAGGPSAKFTVARIFGDHMVLQRGREVPVWGTAASGKKVTVTIAGKTASATSDKAGKWMARLPSMKAGGPHEMTITGGQTPRAYKDVLIGEVWFCSGQSNMVTPVTFELKEIADKEIPAANHPQLRFRRRVWGGKWELCTPETAAPFPGTAYFFGRDLHKALKVPVGLVVEANGGTPIETYMSKDAQIAAAPPEKKEAVAKRAKNNRQIEMLIPYAITGAIFYQGEGGSSINRYDICLKEMVKDWRAKWGQGDFPFLNVQISSGNIKALKRMWTNPPKPGSGASGRLNVQHYQFMGLKIPASGLATAADRGVSEFCARGRHPQNKRELGRRLALLARSMAYADRTAVGTPLPESLTIKGSTARIKFNNVGEGLKALGSEEGKVIGFAVSPASGRGCRWAAAKIIGKDTVEITRPPGVTTIGRVFYAPGGALMGCNLYNSVNISPPIFVVDEKWFEALQNTPQKNKS